MTDDPQDQNQDDFNAAGWGGNRPNFQNIGGGGGGLFSLLPGLPGLSGRIATVVAFDKIN